MKDYSILIIDDDEVDRYLLKRTLAKAKIGGTVFEATDGKEALSFLENYDSEKQKFGPLFPPLIIFLDVNMPLLDGFGFLERFKKLRASFTEYETSVIMLFSSSQNPTDSEKALSYDFVIDFITKGEISAGVMREKVSKILDLPEE